MDTEEKDELDPRQEMQLGEEFCRQLDRQLGRAAPYFLKRCAIEHDRRPARRKRRVRLLAGLIAAAATLCAALVAWQQARLPQSPDGPLPEAVVALPPAAAGEQPLIDRKGDELQPNIDGAGGEPHAERDREQTRSQQTRSGSFDREPPGGGGHEGGRAGASEPLILGRALKARTSDAGTLLVGHTAVRKVRRQWLERVEWFDPQNGARVQRIVPREEILFVPLPVN